jgi:hypothetical protein
LRTSFRLKRRRFCDPQSQRFRNKTSFIPDGRAYNVDIDGKRLSVQAQSEAGKINLNQSPNPLLNRLLRSCGSESQAELLGKAIAAISQPKTVRRRRF